MAAEDAEADDPVEALTYAILTHGPSEAEEPSGDGQAAGSAKSSSSAYESPVGSPVGGAACAWTAFAPSVDLGAAAFRAPPGLSKPNNEEGEVAEDAGEAKEGAAAAGEAKEEAEEEEDVEEPEDEMHAAEAWVAEGEMEEVWEDERDEEPKLAATVAAVPPGFTPETGPQPAGANSEQLAIGEEVEELPALPAPAMLRAPPGLCEEEEEEEEEDTTEPAEPPSADEPALAGSDEFAAVDPQLVRSPPSSWTPTVLQQPASPLEPSSSDDEPHERPATFGLRLLPSSADEPGPLPLQEEAAPPLREGQEEPGGDEEQHRAAFVARVPPGLCSEDGESPAEAPHEAPAAAPEEEVSGPAAESEETDEESAKAGLCIEDEPPAQGLQAEETEEESPKPQLQRAAARSGVAVGRRFGDPEEVQAPATDETEAFACVGFEDFSLQALRNAASTNGSRQVLSREVGAGARAVEAARGGPTAAGAVSAAGALEEPLLGGVTSALFICFIDASGTAVQVVAQATMAVVACVTSHGSRVVDFALQAEDSHLLVAFENGRVIVFRLSAESAAPRVLLEFEGSPVQSVAWHPVNPRVFLTLHPQRALLWHLQLIVQFSTMRLVGYEALEAEGVPTALRVTSALTENATCEALPQVAPSGGPVAGAKRLHELLQGAASAPVSASSENAAAGQHGEDEAGGPLARATFPLDGQFLVASTERVIWAWRLKAKDEQTAPHATCLQRHELPEGLAGSITHLRLVPRHAADRSSFYILMAVTSREVLFWKMDPRPSGGTGYWMPFGRLLCPVQQRLCFPCSVSADIFVPFDAEDCPKATLVIAVQESGGSEAPLFVTGNLTNGEGRCPIVPMMSAFEIPLQPPGCNSGRPMTVRAFERSARARALPEGAELHSWAVTALTLGDDGTATCRCLALPRQRSPTSGTPLAEVPELQVEPEAAQKSARAQLLPPPPQGPAPGPPESPPVSAALATREVAAAFSTTEDDWVHEGSAFTPTSRLVVAADAHAQPPDSAEGWLRVQEAAVATLAPEPAVAEASLALEAVSAVTVAAEVAEAAPVEASAAEAAVAEADPPEASVAGASPAEASAEDAADAAAVAEVEDAEAAEAEEAEAAVAEVTVPDSEAAVTDAEAMVADAVAEVAAEEAVAAEVATGAGEAVEAEAEATPEDAEGSGHQGSGGNGKEGSGRLSRKIVASDTEEVTPQMIRNLARFMEKRAAQASNDLVDAVKNKLPAQLSGKRSRGSNRESRPNKEGAQETLKTVIKESSQMVEQVSRGERTLTQVLKKLSDAEALKQTAGHKPFKDAIEKELMKFRDGSLPKVVLKAAEGRAFADRFADGLQAAGLEAAPLFEALQPTRQQLQEVLQSDLTTWCTSAATKKFKSILQDSTYPQARGAVEASMNQVSNQFFQAWDRILEESRLKGDAERLSGVCTARVREAVRQEVSKWEEEVTRRMPPQRGPATPIELQAMRESFASRMRSAAAPLSHDLEIAEREVELITESLGRCRETAAELEQLAAGASGRALTERELVFEALASGRLQEALQEALKWDAANRGAEVSLVERALDHLRAEAAAKAGEESSLHPDDVLLQAELSTKVDGQTKLLLMFCLLQRATFDSVAVDRIEANLDWAFGLLQTVDNNTSEQGFAGRLEVIRSGANEALEKLRRGEPRALAEAAPGTRRAIADTARLVLKNLDVLAGRPAPPMPRPLLGSALGGLPR